MNTPRNKEPNQRSKIFSRRAAVGGLGSERKADQQASAIPAAKLLQWFLIGAALVFIAVVAQGVHDVAIEHLGVPYPTLINPPAWLAAAGDAGRVLSLVVFCRAARDFLRQRSLFSACLIVIVLELALSERLRVTFIDFCLTESWIGDRWLYSLTSLVPRLAAGVAQGVFAVMIARQPLARRLALMICAALLAGGLVRFAVAPLAEQATSHLNAALGLVAPKELHEPPYNPGMLFIIYLTFLEPTIAAFIMSKLAWPGLKGGAGLKTVSFTLIILGATGRLTLFFLNSFWVQQPFGMALLSTGQFVAEVALMAALVGWLSTNVVGGLRGQSYAAP